MLVLGLPHGIGVGDALHVAGAVGKLHAIDFRFDVHEQYTIWSGLIGGTFLSLSYFGCDQSQVQRYLTAKSLDQSRQSLLLSAFVKIPLQALILLTGVFMFTFFLFQSARRCCSTRCTTPRCRRARAGPEYQALEQEFEAPRPKRDAAERLADAQGRSETRIRPRDLHRASSLPRAPTRRCATCARTRDDARQRRHARRRLYAT